MNRFSEISLFRQGSRGKDSGKADSRRERGCAFVTLLTVRHSILHLSVLPRRFKMLRAGAGNQSRPDPWQPTSADYEAGRVFEPSLLADVIRRLKADRQVLVRGHGASGKTTLANLVAIDVAFRSCPTYYLDLENSFESQESFRSEAIEDFAEFSAAGVVFVVDNIHLAEALRKDDSDRLGTHEIQLWLGLMRMAQSRPTPISIRLDQGERVLKLLTATQAPTSQARETRSRLLSWLQDCVARNWLSSPS